MGRRLLTMLAIFAGAFGAGLVVKGLSDDPEPAIDLPRGGVRGTVSTPTTPRARRRPRPAATPAVATAVRRLADEMPRARQVAQLFMVGFEGTDATVLPALRERGWGGLVLTADNVLSPDQGAVLAQEAVAGAQVSPLVATEGVSGFEPPPQSPADRPAAVRAAARAEGERLRLAGVTLVLAPLADVGIEASEGTFGDHPRTVARLTSAAVAGYREGGVIAAPGHFPGQGAASQDPLEGPSTVGLSKEELAVRDLVPFEAIAGNVRAVVVSGAAFAAYDPVTPASLTPAVLRELRALGFVGVAMTDDLAGATAATAGSTGEAAVTALRAGVDFVRISDPAEAEAAYAAVLAAVKKRTLSPARLREALHRVLMLKRAAGLLR